MRLRQAGVAAVVVLMSACQSPLDIEHCDPRDGAPEAVRARVLGGIALIGGARVLECVSDAMGRPDVEWCALELRPADFMTLFPPQWYFEPLPPPRSGFAIAERNALVIVGGLGGRPYSSDRSVYFNEARDRVLVRSVNYRCGTPRDIVD